MNKELIMNELDFLEAEELRIQEMPAGDESARQRMICEKIRAVLCSMDAGPNLRKEQELDYLKNKLIPNEAV